MYRYDINRMKIKKAFMSIVLFLSISIGSIAVYELVTTNYELSQIKNQQPEIRKVSQNIIESIGVEPVQEVSDIVEETIKSVVGISKIKNSGTSIFGKTSVQQLGLGTGVVISENGYILTNEHVSGARYSTCYITLENGDIYNGNVVWSDSNLDVAIVKINMKGMTPITLGDSDTVKIAEKVYAIGNPIGVEFQRTVTSGIISGKNRTIRLEENEIITYMEDLIQTDATINPGNSGGPLINERGEMLAINSVKITSAEGIGFAIPINIIKPVIEQMVTTGKFDEAYLGIFAYDRGVIPYIEHDVGFDKGIYVAQVDITGPARDTGLKVGDIILKIDNQQVDKMSELRQYIYTKKPDDEVSLVVLRGNNELQIKVVLGRK